MHINYAHNYSKYLIKPCQIRDNQRLLIFQHPLILMHRDIINYQSKHTKSYETSNENQSSEDVTYYKNNNK